MGTGEATLLKQFDSIIKVCINQHGRKHIIMKRDLSFCC